MGQREPADDIRRGAFKQALDHGGDDVCLDGVVIHQRRDERVDLGAAFTVAHEAVDPL